MSKLIKPAQWAVTPAFVAPEWRWFWVNLVDVVLFNENVGQPVEIMHNEILVRDNSPAWETMTIGPSRSYGSGSDKLTDRLDRQLLEETTIYCGVYSRVALSHNNFVQIFEKADADGRPANYVFNFKNSTSQIQWQWTTASTFQAVSFTGQLPLNETSHWAMTRNVAGTAGKLYKNGLEVASNSGLLKAENSTVQTSFGARSDGSIAFDGNMLYLYLLKAEHTPAQVKQLYQDPFGPFRMHDEAGVVYGVPAPPVAGGRLLLLNPPGLDGGFGTGGLSL